MIIRGMRRKQVLDYLARSGAVGWRISKIPGYSLIVAWEPSMVTQMKAPERIGLGPDWPVVLPRVERWLKRGQSEWTTPALNQAERDACKTWADEHDLLFQVCPFETDLTNEASVTISCKPGKKFRIDPGARSVPMNAGTSRAVPQRFGMEHVEIAGADLGCPLLVYGLEKAALEKYLEENGPDWNVGQLFVRRLKVAWKSDMVITIREYKRTGLGEDFAKILRDLDVYFSEDKLEDPPIMRTRALNKEERDKIFDWVEAKNTDRGVQYSAWTDFREDTELPWENPMKVSRFTVSPCLLDR